MESVLEQQRKLLEERERVEDALVKEKMLKKATVSGGQVYSVENQGVKLHQLSIVVFTLTLYTLAV